ncbi:hypothetical protein FRC04_003067 [Tulasnella sp. 424]|nr:hypothetical protein FRC04_003067 [Tulasnella sp. 424]
MTALPASPASLTDAALDELEEDAGIFLSKEVHPREEYYQRRITRSRTRHLVNETELPVTINPQPKSTQLSFPTDATEEAPSASPGGVRSNPEEQGADDQLARSSEDLSPPRQACAPSGMEEHVKADELTEEPVSEAAGPLDILSSTGAPLADTVPSPPTSTSPHPPTLNNDTLPSIPHQTPQTPSTDLICFESFQLPSPTRATGALPGTDTLTSQTTDFLCGSPVTLPPHVPNDQPASTPGHPMEYQAEAVDKQLLFTPRTTASFAVEMHVPINPAFLMTKERDNPTLETGVLDQETEEQEDEKRPAKRAKAETPVKKSALASSARNPKPTPAHVPQRAPLLGQSANLRSPEKGRFLAGSTSHRPIAPKTPTRPFNSSMKARPTPARHIFSTPQRPTATPQRPATTSKTGPVLPPAVSTDAPTAPKLPSDFRFVFQPNMAMPRSPEAQSTSNSQTSGAEVKPVLLNNFKFVREPASPSGKPSLSSPAKPSTTKSLGSSVSRKDPTTGATRASPIKFNMALLSPKKAAIMPESSPGKAEHSVYGSPVRFVRPVAPRPNPSSTLQSSTASTSGPFKGKAAAKAALPAAPEIPTSPLKPVNGRSTVIPKSTNQSSSLVKPTALPKPKGFKFSKLPKPAGIPVPQYARTTTVNMVHVPRVDLGGTPTQTHPRTETLPAPLPPMVPAAAPPPRKKIFRPVVPGTLTGWEGKPATMIETQDKSPAPESPKPPSDSSPEITSSEGDASTVRKSSRRKVSGTRTPSPETANGPSKPEADEQSSPRRSRRISKEKENTTAQEQPIQAAPVSRPSAAPRGRAAATPKAPPAGVTGFQMSDKELKSLTMKNTVRNQTYFVEIDLQVIRKECPRPPSPSTRVRAAIGIEEKEAEAKKRGRAERAKRRGLLEDEMDREEDESPLKHPRAPGDDEEYETPKRRRLDGEGGFVAGNPDPEQRFAALQLQPQGKQKPRSRGGSSDPDAAIPSKSDPMDRFVKPNSKGRFVRWNKKLAFHCEPGEQPKLPSTPGKGILARDAAAAKLDKVGNVPEAGTLPPEVRKNVVVVFKYVYADDPPEHQEDVEMEEEEEDEYPSPPKKGKRKRLA